MKKLSRLALIIFSFYIFANFTNSQSRLQGFVENGNFRFSASSTARVQQSLPSATVTVFNAGTVNLATIYSNSSLTPKSNPFTADSNGYWFFYALNGKYDIQFTHSLLSSPSVLADVVANDGAISGAVNGDLSGTLPNPTVDGLRGRAIASTAPTNNQALVWNSTNSQWTPKDLSDAINVKRDYNAIADGASDDTDEIRAAVLAAKTARRNLYFPSGTYLWGGVGATDLIFLDKSIKIFADSGAILLAATGTPTTANFITISPPAVGIGGFACSVGPPINCDIYNSATDNRGYEVRGLTFRAQTPGQAGKAVYVDTDGANQYVHDFSIADNNFEDLGSYSIHFDNTTNGSSQVNTDSIFRAKIINNTIFDGILCEFCADSITVFDNTFRGLNTSEFSFTTGAANFRFIINNYTEGGGLKIRNGTSPIIFGNYMELFFPGSTGSDNAVLNIAGDIAPIESAIIEKNTFGAVLGILTSGVRINAASNSRFVGNLCNIPATKFCLVETSSASFTEFDHNATIGGGNTYSSAGTNFYTGVVAWKNTAPLYQDGQLAIQSANFARYHDSMVEVSTDFIFTTTDLVTAVAMSASSGAKNVTLPPNNTLQSANRVFRIVKTDGTANAVNIVPQGADTINNSATPISLTTPFDCRMIQGSIVAGRFIVMGRC